MLALLMYSEMWLGILNYNQKQTKKKEANLILCFQAQIWF